MGRRYDPHQHAHSLGVTVVEGRPRLGGWGEYSHASRTITLRSGLSRREARCTLAHELQHAIAGDIACRSSWFAARMERRADEAAAILLVDPVEYREAEAMHNGHLPSIAYDLDVTPEVLLDWQRMCREVLAWPA